MVKFLNFCDSHYGFERVNGKIYPIHDIKAINAMLKFAKDFKPDVVIASGDIIDAGCVSHHNHGKPGQTEGLKLIDDVRGAHKVIIAPIEALKPKQMIYITGNHCAWLNQLTDIIPSLEGLLDLKTLLKLDKWKVIPQGGQFDLGKLTFLHGDGLSGGEGVAKAAVTNYERSVRFGHHHTFAVHSKTSASEYKNGKTGICVPCLCKKNPAYSKAKPNKWLQGFNWGFVEPNGSFTDYISTIIDGHFIGPNGKSYQG